MNHGKDPFESFSDSVNIEQQRKLLVESTEIIEKLSGITPEIFRAPRMQISDKTFTILHELGYRKDSSITSGRFDFGLGSVNNFKHFKLSPHPYNIKTADPNIQILEIPPSAYILPLNMRLLRIFNLKIVEKILSIIALKTDNIVFYLHPTEFVKPTEMQIPSEENHSFFKNCSSYNFKKLEAFINLINRKGFEYCLM